MKKEAFNVFFIIIQFMIQLMIKNILFKIQKIRI